MKTKKFIVELTKEELDVLAMLAKECRCEMKDIVEAFVSDLTANYLDWSNRRTNGSDERMYALNYYERLGWSYSSWDDDE